MFMTTTHAMAVAGQWTLMTQYFVLITQIIAIREGVVIAVVPTDKPIGE